MRHRLWRVVFPAIYGAIIAGAGYLASWRVVGQDFAYNVYLEHEMQTNVRAIQNAVHRYCEINSHMPSSAHELGLDREQLQDAWGTPFQIELQSSSSVISSFGRDGEPGGDSHGADYKWPGDEHRTLDKALLPEANVPSLRQFALRLNTSMVTTMAVIIGFIGFVLAFVMTSKQKSQLPFQRRSVKLLGIAALGFIWISSIWAQSWYQPGTKSTFKVSCR